MENRQITLFTPKGEYFEYKKINEENFYETVAYVGLRLCEGYAVLIDDKIFTPIKLPEFLAAMQKLNDIDDLYEYFFPCLVYIKRVQFENNCIFWDSHPEILNEIKTKYGNTFNIV